MRDVEAAISETELTWSERGGHEETASDRTGNAVGRGDGEAVTVVIAPRRVPQHDGDWGADGGYDGSYDGDGHDGRSHGSALVSAVESALRQTIRPEAVIVTDDGSADPETIGRETTDAINELSRRGETDIRIIRRTDANVAAALNAGIAAATTPYVLVLDGHDLLRPDFLASTLPLLRDDDTAVAASGWMSCFGLMDGELRPAGGALADFLAYDHCPGTCLIRWDDWLRCGGYDDGMESSETNASSGRFEGWEFHLRLLEHGGPHAHVAVAERPLIDHEVLPGESYASYARSRTAALKHIVERHRESYAENAGRVVADLDALAGERLHLWENAVQTHPELRQHSMLTRECLEHPGYGDGGVEAAARINRARCSVPYYAADMSSGNVL
nr:glycosyltransferase family A protein [Bifidobacterium simiarum]